MDGSFGGLEHWWWDFTAICGNDSPSGAPAQLSHVSMAWNARKLLRAIFGDKANAAYSTCYKWAEGEESLREAVSAACEWAILYHHGYRSYEAYVKAGRMVHMRHGQSVSLKPGNFIRESLDNALPEARRREAFIKSEYVRVGNKRQWQRGYEVVTVSPMAEPNPDGEDADIAPPWDDVRFRARPNNYMPLECQPADVAYNSELPAVKVELIEALVGLVKSRVAEDEPLGVKELEAALIDGEESYRDIAARADVSLATVYRAVQRVRDEFRKVGKDWTHRKDRVPIPARSEGSGRSGGIWYGQAVLPLATDPKADLDQARYEPDIYRERYSGTHKTRKQCSDLRETVVAQQ